MARTRKVINPNDTEKTAVAAAGNTVLVAYNGVQAQAFDVPMNNGAKKRVIINGNNADLVGKPRGELYAGGYGLTAIDRDVWEWIKKNYAQWGAIKNGLMFATTEESAAAEIKERAELKNGFEPLKRESISGVTEKGK